MHSQRREVFSSGLGERANRTLIGKSSQLLRDTKVHCWLAQLLLIGCDVWQASNGPS